MECVIRKIKGWTSPYWESPAFSNSAGYIGVDLTLADSEHFRATGRAYALGCWLAVFHGDAFGIFHFLFGTAFHAVCLHLLTSLFSLP